MTAEKDKRGNIPAHNKHTNGDTDHGSADGIDIAHVLRRQIQGIGAKALHERTIYCAKQNKPKDQQCLVLAKVKKKQLDG